MDIGANIYYIVTSDFTCHTYGNIKSEHIVQVLKTS